MRPIVVSIHLILLLDFCIRLIALNNVAYYYYNFFIASDLWVEGSVYVVFG
jgi:hypothetical protein